MSLTEDSYHFDQKWTINLVNFRMEDPIAQKDHKKESVLPIFNHLPEHNNKKVTCCKRYKGEKETFSHRLLCFHQGQYR